MENKYGNILTIIMIIALILIIAILGFFGIRAFTTSRRENETHDIISEFDKNTGSSSNSTNTGNQTIDGNNTLSLNEILSQFDNSGNQIVMGSGSSSEGGSKDTYYNGYKVIGTISIPTINIEYPILEENTSEALKIGITAIYPQDTANAVNKPGNLVLWGHNYKNGTFFSDLNKLTTGDKIYIKDTSGQRVTYTIYNQYETTDADFTYATRDTDGAREITLSTCTEVSGYRTIVWAREVQ